MNANMKMRIHYALNFLKENLPLIITLFIAIFLIGFVPSATSVKVQQYYGSSDYHIQDTFLGQSPNFVGAGIFYLTIPTIVSTILFAVKTFSYRYTKESADMHMSLPFKEREIKWIRMIVFTIALILIFTVTFFSSTLIYYVRALEKYKIASLTLPVKYSHFIVVYLLGLVSVLTTYFIMLVFGNLANRGGRSFLYILLSQVVLGLFILLPLMFYMNELVGEEETAFSKWLGNLDRTTFSYSFITPIVFLSNFFRTLLNGSRPEGIAPTYALSFIIYVVLGVASGAFIALIKDPSGEYAGDRRNRNKFFSILVHIAFFTLAFLPIFDLDGLVIVIYVLCITLYYIFLSVLGGSFKLNKRDLIIMLLIDAMYIAMFVLTIAK